MVWLFPTGRENDWLHKSVKKILKEEPRSPSAFRRAWEDIATWARLGYEYRTETHRALRQAKDVTPFPTIEDICAEDLVDAYTAIVQSSMRVWEGDEIWKHVRMGSDPREIDDSWVELSSEHSLCPPVLYETGFLREEESVPYLIAK